MTDIEKNIRSYKNKTCKNQHKTQIGERRLQSQIAHAHLTQTQHKYSRQDTQRKC